jgi:hypothetical protein
MVRRLAPLRGRRSVPGDLLGDRDELVGWSRPLDLQLERTASLDGERRLEGRRLVRIVLTPKRQPSVTSQYCALISPPYFATIS